MKALYVGIDIGSSTHYVRTFDGRELNSVKPLSSATVSIEPTGHYWFDFGDYLENEGILLVKDKVD